MQLSWIMISAFKLNKSDSFDLCTVVQVVQLPLSISTGFVVLFKINWSYALLIWADAQFLSEYCQNYFYSKTTVYKLNINEDYDQLVPKRNNVLTERKKLTKIESKIWWSGPLLAKCVP